MIAIFDDNYLKNKSYLEVFIALDKHEITEDSVRNFYNIRSQNVSSELRGYLDSIFSGMGYHVAVKKELTAVHSNTTNRQLLKNKITIYESTKKVGQSNYLSSGSWEMNYTKSISENERTNDHLKNDSTVVNYGFLVSRNSTFTISNMNWILFKELVLFVVASFLILIAILYIFYITYINLLKQNKQVLVLHDMVDNVSHELRTPISTLKLASKNLQKKHQDSNFSVLDRQILRLEKLLEPLTKPSANQERIYYSHHDLKLLLGDLLAPESLTKVNLTSFPQQGIYVNKASFETILSNLITNSIKYGASQVNLSVDLNKDFLQLKVHDDGQGIAENDLPYIFEKFYRVQKDNIHASKGFGLGLYIVKQLVDQINGEIKVKSQLNKGSEFLIILPYGK